MRAHTLTIAAAESLTVGRVQTLLGLVSGASDYFLGGVTAYTLEQKEKLLGVPRSESQPCAGVSESIARQLALGARRLFGAEIAVSTTGFAEPAPEHGEPFPMAWWALAWAPPDGKEQTQAGRVAWPDTPRQKAQDLTTLAAAGALLHLLRKLRAQ